MIRIELWVEERDGAAAVNPVMATVIDRLRADGFAVAVRVPERDLIDDARLESAELILLKTATTLGLSAALATETTAARCLNSAGATVRAHDKAETIARLAAAGLPVPTTYLTAGGQMTAPADADHGAWFVKPTRGVHGRGVQRVAHVPTAVAVAPSEPGVAVIDDGTRLVQRAIGERSADLKVYVAGDRIFAGRKPFDAGSYQRNGIARVDPDQQVCDIVQATGAALDLTIFGVDLRDDGDGWAIIDANPFPGFRGFPEAVSPLVDLVHEAVA